MYTCIEKEERFFLGDEDLALELIVIRRGNKLFRDGAVKSCSDEPQKGATEHLSQQWFINAYQHSEGTQLGGLLQRGETPSNINCSFPLYMKPSSTKQVQFFIHK